MKKYVIDIIDEWGNSPRNLNGVHYCDDFKKAILWGKNHTEDDHPVYNGFFISKLETDEVLYHSWDEDVKPIYSRLEILDIR